MKSHVHEIKQENYQCTSVVSYFVLSQISIRVRNILKQGCIPVGCVPSARWSSAHPPPPSPMQTPPPGCRPPALDADPPDVDPPPECRQTGVNIVLWFWFLSFVLLRVVSTDRRFFDNDCDDDYFCTISLSVAHTLRLRLWFITGRNEVVAKVIFLHLSVILFTGGVCQGEPPLPGKTPPCQGEPPRQGEPPTCQGEPPWDQTPPPWDQTPPGPDPPQDQSPPGPDPPPPPPEEDCSIRSTSGQYASYWNAFVFLTTNGQHAI